MYICCSLAEAGLAKSIRPRLRVSTCLVRLAQDRRQYAEQAAKTRHALSDTSGCTQQDAAFGQSTQTALQNTKEYLDPTQLLQTTKYMNLLITQNATLNLTAAEDEEKAFEMHVEDSLALLPLLDSVALQYAKSVRSNESSAQQFSIIDVGSGGGLPGVIIAIARPDWQVTLLDSLRKRCNFVEKAVQQVGLHNIEVVWGRAEEVGQSQQHREVYDVAIARAVARMRVLCELCLPLVKPGGHCLAAKGPDCQKEVAEAGRAIAVLQGELMSISSVNAFGSTGQHMAVLVKKLGTTPSKYPRQPGKPNKRPL